MFNSWWLPTVLSAVGLGVYDICKKHAVKNNSVMPVLFLATLFGTLFFIAVSAVNGQLIAASQCSAVSFFQILLKAAIVSSSWICVYYAMRELPISLASPIRSTSPLWTMIGGIMIFKEIPSAFQAFGMAVILVGYMLFSVLGKREGFTWKNKGMLLIIAGTVLGSLSALYDKYLLNTVRIDRQIMQMYFSIDLVIFLGSAWGIRKLFGVSRPFVWKWSIPATGVLLVLSDYSYFFALSQDSAPVSMVSLVRRCSCIVTFAAGVIIFKDKNIKVKAWALVLLITGAVLLALAK